MINRIRKLLGLCVHEWGPWRSIKALDNIEVGRTRQCHRCSTYQSQFYPDGH